MGFTLGQVREWLQDRSKTEYVLHFKNLLEAEPEWDETKELSDYIQYILDDMSGWLSKTPRQWRSEKALRKPLTIINYFLKENQTSIQLLGGTAKCKELIKELSDKFRDHVKAVIEERAGDTVSIASSEDVLQEGGLSEETFEVKYRRQLDINREQEVINKKLVKKLDAAKSFMKMNMKPQDLELALGIIDSM